MIAQNAKATFDRHRVQYDASVQKLSSLKKSKHVLLTFGLQPLFQFRRYFLPYDNFTGYLQEREAGQGASS
jgi:hypothetical protein